jgi:hypothetical protein
VHVHILQSSGVSLEENTFRECSGWSTWIETYSGSVELKDNRFRDCSRGGAKITGQGGLGSASLVNNVFAGTTTGPGALVEMDSVTVTNNTFISNREGLEIVLTEDDARAEIYNNIIWGSTNEDVIVDDDKPGDGTGAAVEVFNNDFSVLTVEVGDHLTQGDNLDIDPQLAVDFHLLPFSPVIDQGTDAPGLPGEDFEGDDRTIDANNDGTSELDMGADEVSSYDPAPRVTCHFTGGRRDRCTAGFADHRHLQQANAGGHHRHGFIPGNPGRAGGRDLRSRHPNGDLPVYQDRYGSRHHLHGHDHHRCQGRRRLSADVRLRMELHHRRRSRRRH